jgi:hypothetical protein
MEKLLDDILEYSRVERQMDIEDCEMCSGATLLDDVQTLVEIPEGFTLKAGKGFYNLKLPRLAMQRVLCNLIHNAIKHHDKARGTIEIDFEDDGGQYIFCVSDDGPGIPAAYHHKIFEMFQTLKPRDIKEGSGMGLAFVKKIITLYGGTITLSSGPGRGSMFRFTWPKKMKELPA